MSSLNLIILFSAFLVFAAFFAACETALFGLPRPRLRRLARMGGPGAQLFREVLENPHRVLVGILLGSTLANVAVTAVSALLLHRLLGATWPLAAVVALQVLVTSFVLLVFGDLAPKTYALERGERFAVRLAPALRLAAGALVPVARGLEGVARAAARLFGGSPATGAGVEDLRTLIDEGTRRGALTPDEARLFEGAFRLRHLRAADVMTPRADLIAAPADTSVAEVLELVAVSGRSRIPLYEGTLDRIVGVVEARDLVPHALDQAEPRPARDLARPPFFVSPERAVESLLREMQSERVQLVVVGPEGQEALGIVTLEDILEEVVGEIEGEFEEDEPAVRLLEDGSGLVRANVRVSDVNRLLGTTLPSEDGDTVEALVRKLWPEQPAEGEETATPGGDRVSIESTAGPRVWSVRVRPASLGERP